MKGELPFMQKAAALQEELMMFMPQEIGDGPLEQEVYLLGMAKKVFMMVAGAAVQKYGEQLENEQEVLSNVADIVSEIYSMESVILRTEKALKTSSQEETQQKLLLTEVFCQEAFQRIEAGAKEALLAIEEGDTVRTMFSILRKLTRHMPKNVIKIKRQIAAKVLAEERYVV